MWQTKSKTIIGAVVAAAVSIADALGYGAVFNAADAANITVAWDQIILTVGALTSVVGIRDKLERG